MPDVWWLAIDVDYSSYEELKQRKAVAQGWPDLGNISFLRDLSAANQQQLRDLAVQVGYDEKPVRVFDQLLGKVKPGDLVLGREGIKVRGVGEICDCSMYGFDRDGSFTGVDPTSFGREEFNYAQCLFPVLWVDWDQTGVRPPRGPRIVPGIRRLRIDKDLVLQAWQDHKIRNAFDPCPQAFTEDSRLAMEKTMLQSRFASLEATLNQYGQVILNGPPGTGKTYLAQRFVHEHWNLQELAPGDDLSNGGFRLVQFHPAYNYEDFVRGIRVTTNNGHPAYETVNRTFGELALAALTHWKGAQAQATQELGASATEPAILNRTHELAKRYVLIIDEINRAHLAAVLGELIYALEYRSSRVQTPYAIEADHTLIVPPNLYIIGTMNTADRSIGHIDYAVRRRFAFLPLLPHRPTLEQFYADKDANLRGEALSLFDRVADLFRDQQYFSPDYHADDVHVGHTYFMAISSQHLSLNMTHQVIPILREYVKDGVLRPAATAKLDELAASASHAG
jgi:MoxR-like ATPase